MSDAAEFLESFSVECSRCRCRFQPAVRATSYFAKCPDCAEPVRVPAEAEVEDDWKREQAAGEGETYRLSLPTDWDTPDTPSATAEPSQPQKSSNSKDKNEDTEPERSPAKKKAAAKPTANTVSCPACGADFEASLSDQPQVVLCPECLEDVHVPAGSVEPALSPKTPEAEDEDYIKIPEPEPRSTADEEIPWDTYLLGAEEPAPQLPKKPKKQRRKKTTQSTDPEKNPSRGHRPEKHIDDVMAEVRQVEEDPPPEWTFFSGVTDFLIRPAVAIRWVCGSFGLCLMGWLIAGGIYFYGLLPIAAVVFALPLIFVTIMTLSYVAANSLPILLETAAGNDQVEGWPDPSLKDQAVDLIYLSFILIITEVLSFFLGQIVGIFIGPQWLVSMVLAFLLYPIVLLSSLEANSPYVPFTLPILKSLKTVTWAWGVFYGLSFGLLLVWGLPLLWVFSRGFTVQFFGMMFIAPLIVGWCFLTARLLGRLAWRASLEFDEEEEDENQEKPKRKKSKKKPNSPKKRDLSESSGELQSAR